MMKKLTLLLCLAAFFKGLTAQYAVSDIPAELLKDADAVKRSESCTFEVLGMGKSKYTRIYAITILNENGDRYAGNVLNYNKLREVKTFDGALYDAGGKKIKQLKKADIKDLSGVDGISLMDDNRIKVHNFYHKTYPYTVEYTTVEHYNFNMFFPPWDPYEGDKIAVQQSKMTVIAPEDFMVRYKGFNYDKAPVKSLLKGMMHYTWEITNNIAIQTESYSPGWTELVPIVFFAPSSFQMDKYVGDMSSWQQLGEFMYNLNKGRDDLPDGIKQKVRELISGEQDVYKKIDVLYRYLQQNSRYVSVQLGIGGWQTFDAAYVASRNYGDCKALSNYMVALLKEAGIKSHYTLIRNGRNLSGNLNDFPSSQFNHIIVCVPLQQDTVWLECTSNTMPAGYIGFNNANRQVLLIDETGGKPAFTPAYKMAENTQIRKTVAIVKEDGFLDAKLDASYRAVQQEHLHQLLHGMSKEKQLEQLKKSIDLPHYDVNEYLLAEVKGKIPQINEFLHVVAPNYASVTGKRLFVMPNIFTKTSGRLKEDKARKYEVKFNYAYHDLDSSEITLPLGYKPEALPKPVKIETIFGTYENRVEVNGNQIKYFREVKMNEGVFPAEAYQDFVVFYNNMYKHDRERIVMVKE